MHQWRLDQGEDCVLLPRERGGRMLVQEVFALLHLLPVEADHAIEVVAALGDGLSHFLLVHLRVVHSVVPDGK